MHAGGCAALPLLRPLLIARCVVIASEPAGEATAGDPGKGIKTAPVLGCFRGSEFTDQTLLRGLWSDGPET